MKKKIKTSTKLLAFMLALFLAFSYCISVSGEYYMDSHPHAVNENMTDAEIEKQDLENFKDVSGYDYHDADPNNYAPNEIIVQISSTQNTSKATISSIKSEYGLYSGSILRTHENIASDDTSASSAKGQNNIIYTCHFLTTEDDIISLCDRLNKEDSVFNAQPNFKYTICEDNSVNMAEMSETEAYTEPRAFSTSTYQDNLKWWFDYCNISSAWETYADSSTGYGMGKGINVAVIDTGCNTAHEDIKDNLWSHPDNSNACGYYAYKKQYVTKNAQFDQNGHGSHCCGTIAMSGDNNVGGIGTAPKCKLMVMKADRGTGTGGFYDSDIIVCLQKSKEYGADIISMSLGSYDFSYATFQTYQEVSSSCLIVCAAGNAALDTTQKLHFPSAASFNIGVMAMSASKTNPTLATFSNYDTKGIYYKVAAPGTEIYSLDYSGNNTYKLLQGTSMATPAAAGMMASYMSYIKYVKGYNWTPAQYQYRIESTINASSNSLEIGALSSYYHPAAYESGSKFKVCNLKQLIANGSGVFSNPSATTFSNNVIKNGVINATGLSASEINTYVLKRVSILHWGDTTNTQLQSVSDFSDLSKLTGLNYLDLSGSTGVTQSNLDTVISKCPETLLYLDLSTSASLTDISCLANSSFSCLHYLNISGNSIENIGPIAKFTSLSYLYAQNNKIKDISALSGMKFTEIVDLSNNKVEDPNPALISYMIRNLNLSNNKLSDYTQLYNFKGALYSTSLNSKNIYIDVKNNYMADLTQSIVDDIKANIKTRNTYGGTVYAETIEIYWSGQTSTTLVPMTSFTITDKIVTDTADNSITREAFCSGNLNLNSITGFRAYPSNANQYKYLNWTCSEEGYCASDGTILVTPDKITSTRTLSFTGTAPEVSGATYYGTSETSKTIKITITAPEIYNAYLSERVTATGNQVTLIATTNKYASSLVLRSGTSTNATTYATYDLTNAVNKNALANGECYQYLFSLPSTIYNNAGTYQLYLFATDSAGNYTTNTSADVSGKTAYAYKNIGSLYIKDSVAYSSNISLVADKTVNRYGQAAIFSVNAGTSSTSPARISGSYGLNIDPRKYIGTGKYYTAYALGYTGIETTGYPNANTGTTKITLSIDDYSATADITTVAPEVKNVTIRNKLSAKTDGYIEYLVKTNTDATGVKAVDPTTSEVKENVDIDHILTTTGTATTTYGVYNSSTCYKLWVMRVPLKSNKSADEIKIVAFDPIGDGTVTKTPATSIKAPATQKIYIDSARKYRNFSTDLVYYPVDDSGNSLADCCKTVTYTIPQTDNFYINSETSGLVYCNYDNILQNNSSSYASAKVTLTLENGASDYTYLRAYVPYIDTVTYDTQNSILTTGGTVYYTAKTYGVDTLYIKDNNSQYTEPAQVLTLDDTDCYTSGVDDNNNNYILWNFERVFGDSDPLRTYLGGSYKYSDSITAQTSSLKPLSVWKAFEVGDYSSWEEQLARLIEDNIDLARAHYDDDEEFQYNLAAVQDIIDNAYMYYEDNEQDLIDRQTNLLKDYIDILFGYDCYDYAISEYDRVVCEGIYYIPEQLSELVYSDYNDSNVLEIAKEILNYLDNLELMADTSLWEETLASIPQNYSEVFTEGENYFVYLKADIDAIDELTQIQFVQPLPASMQPQIDRATESLTQALSDLLAHKIDVTALVKVLMNKDEYCQKISAYTLPDNLAEDYLTKINAIDLFALTSQEDAALIYNDINATIISIDEFCTAVDELSQYSTFLENNVKGITSSKPLSPYYSDETYSPLKAKYDEVKQNLANNNAGYTSLQTLTEDLATLQSLYSTLHTHNFVLTIAETCTYKYMQCECGELVKVPYEEGDGEHSHSLSQIMSTNIELCDGTHAVIEYQICNACGTIEYISGEEYINSHEHNWVVKEDATVAPEILSVSEGVNSKQPSCTNSGATVYICEDCGIFKAEDIAPLGHTFTGEWFVFRQPTETVEGEKRCKCERCDEYISESIAVLPPRAEIIIPFSAEGDEMRGITIKAYPSGIKPPYADPLYTFTEQEDEEGYKIEIDAENKTYSIRLPLNYNYDLVIQKDGYTPYSINALSVENDDIDLRDFNTDNRTRVMAVLYAGDFNADGKVNALDRIALAPYIGYTTEDKDKIYDLDNSGVIDIADKALLLRDYMNSEKYVFISELD